MSTSDLSGPHFPTFLLGTWDGLTNPFAESSRETIPSGAGPEHAQAPGATACRKRFATQFHDMFLAPAPPPVPPDLSPFSRLQKTTLQRADSPQGMQPELPHPLWSKRLTGLAETTRSHPELIRLRRSWNWSTLVREFPWQNTAHAMVRVHIHRHFARAFSAVGPEFHLFVDEHLLSGEDPLPAAQLIHECAHLDHGFRVGWSTYQSLSVRELETIAVAAERTFLHRLAGDLGSPWPTSPLRMAWNLSYAKAAASLTLSEAQIYFDAVSACDPLPQTP